MSAAGDRLVAAALEVVAETVDEAGEITADHLLKVLADEGKSAICVSIVIRGGLRTLLH